MIPDYANLQTRRRNYSPYELTHLFNSQKKLNVAALRRSAHILNRDSVFFGLANEIAHEQAKKRGSYGVSAAEFERAQNFLLGLRRRAKNHPRATQTRRSR